MDSLSVVAELGCIVCRRMFSVYSPAEIHHLRAGVGMGQRSAEVIPLCPLHHRRGARGVALHAGKQSFESNYGTELELLDATLKRLEEA